MENHYGLWYNRLMSDVSLSLIQDKEIYYLIRQGNLVVLSIAWLEENSTPSDISGYTFFAQLRDGYADYGGNIIHTFSLTPDINNNHYTVNNLTALTEFHFTSK